MEEYDFEALNTEIGNKESANTLEKATKLGIDIEKFKKGEKPETNEESEKSKEENKESKKSETKPKEENSPNNEAKTFFKSLIEMLKSKEDSDKKEEKTKIGLYGSGGNK